MARRGRIRLIARTRRLLRRLGLGDGDYHLSCNTRGYGVPRLRVWHQNTRVGISLQDAGWTVGSSSDGGLLAVYYGL